METQVLGGEWAIFGDGFVEGAVTSISLEIDLTGIASVSIEQFYVEGDGSLGFQYRQQEGFLVGP